MPIKIDDAHKPIRELTWWESHTHVPHWERPGRSKSSFAQMQVQTHTGNKYLSVTTQEHGDKSSRKTMITLSAEDGRRFYEWLKSVYEPGLVGFTCLHGGACFDPDVKKEAKR